MTLKQKWEFVHELQKLYPENKHCASHLKKEIRQFYKNRPERSPLNRIHYDENGYGYWTLTKFSSEFYSHKDQIMEDMCFDSPHSLYDCTGEKFTMVIKSFQLKDGSFFVYHVVGLDI